MVNYVLTLFTSNKVQVGYIVLLETRKERTKGIFMRTALPLFWGGGLVHADFVHGTV